jgi:SGNH domain (fused to AT3 domains)
VGISRAVSVGLAVGLVAMMVAGGDAIAASASCVGAAARDPKHPCTNPTISVTPTPDRVGLEPGVYCRPRAAAPPAGCRFGASPRTAKRRFVVVGDSHVYQWRATLDIVGKLMHWQGLSIWTGVCYFSDAVKHFERGIRGHCTDWYRSVRAWFGDHPEIDTVFVAQRAETTLDVPPGRTASQVKAAAYQRTWRSLPKTVKHIIVLRDTPKTAPDTLACVRRVIEAAKERPGIACRVPRARALDRDAAVVAAKRLRARRYQYIDLTHYFCSATYCYPVIGGVLVNRDPWGHITLTYSRTLTPYLLRKLRRLMHSW